jgi:hypothetical protein
MPIGESSRGTWDEGGLLVSALQIGGRTKDEPFGLYKPCALATARQESSFGDTVTSIPAPLGAVAGQVSRVQ